MSLLVILFIVCKNKLFPTIFFSYLFYLVLLVHDKVTEDIKCSIILKTRLYIDCRNINNNADNDDSIFDLIVQLIGEKFSNMF